MLFNQKSYPFRKKRIKKAHRIRALRDKELKKKIKKSTNLPKFLFVHAPLHLIDYKDCYYSK
jgi:hypothetical protein